MHVPVRAALVSALFAALSLAASPAGAATLFENDPELGSASGNSAFINPDTWGAENFSLATTSLVQAISFTASVNPSQANANLVSWRLYTNLGTVPDTIVAGAVNAPYSTSVLATASGFDITRYDLDVPDVLLGAGDYWLAFHMDGAGASFNPGPHWQTAVTGDFLSAVTGNDGATWSNNYGNGRIAASVEGVVVPEPSAALSCVLVGLALGLALHRGRSA